MENLSASQGFIPQWESVVTNWSLYFQISLTSLPVEINYFIINN